MENNRIIKVHCKGATNTAPDMIILTEVRFNVATGNTDLTDRHKLTWTHAKTQSAVREAERYLVGLGFNCVGFGSIKNDYYIFSDSWQDGNGFLTIKGGIEQ